MSQRTKPSLKFAAGSKSFIDAYLQPAEHEASQTEDGSKKPFLTLTYAQSLDSKLSLAPGIQTVLSGPETKAMTHYLRSKHDAILVGVGTAIADDPALNCRIEGVGLNRQPRPIILDPNLRWSPGDWPDSLSTCMSLAQKNIGKGPWIITARPEDKIDSEQVRCVKECSGQHITVQDANGQMSWETILKELHKRGIRSLMVEGGATVINTLLSKQNLHLVDTIIITIAPIWLGDAGVNVSPPSTHSSGGHPESGLRLSNVVWQQFGQDVVMCGRVAS